MYRRGIGTLAYQDAWGLFDQVIISHGWLNKEKDGYFYNKALIFNKDFLVQKRVNTVGMEKEPGTVIRIIMVIAITFRCMWCF